MYLYADCDSCMLRFFILPKYPFLQFWSFIILVIVHRFLMKLPIQLTSLTVITRRISFTIGIDMSARIFFCLRKNIIISCLEIRSHFLRYLGQHQCLRNTSMPSLQTLGLSPDTYRTLRWNLIVHCACNIASSSWCTFCYTNLQLYYT